MFSFFFQGGNKSPSLQSGSPIPRNSPQPTHFSVTPRAGTPRNAPECRFAPISSRLVIPLALGRFARPKINLYKAASRFIKFLFGRAVPRCYTLRSVGRCSCQSFRQIGPLRSASASHLRKAKKTNFSLGKISLGGWPHGVSPQGKFFSFGEKITPGFILG